jgi:uncharacterized membrane protein YgcG
MSVEGLRAWIAEVERKLGKRTRVFLALAVIAIGLGGAAIYLAIDARESSVSESDVQALQQKLEARLDEVAAGATAAAPLETEPAPAPAPEGSKPKSETGKQGKSGKNSGGGSSGGASNGASGGPSGGASGSTPSSATGGAANSAKLQELLEQTKKRSEQIEKERAGKATP